MLYLPGGWFHEVTSFGVHMALNFWVEAQGLRSLCSSWWNALLLAWRFWVAVVEAAGGLLLLENGLSRNGYRALVSNSGSHSRYTSARLRESPA